MSYTPLSFTKWQLHLLNSKFADGTKGRVNDSTLQQLQHDIVAKPDVSHLIAVHHHPVDCNGWMDAHEWVNRSDFMAVVAANPQVKGVIHGHIHHASEQIVGNCCFMSTPATCWQFANQATFAVSEEAPGFRLLELEENGTLHSQVIRIEGHIN